MSISSRLEAINQHLLDDYSILTLAGADLTNVDKNIQNLKQSWEERLLYFLANGTDTLWNNWEKVTGSGETITLNNTIEAKMNIVYKGNTSQTGTPTPDNPINIDVVSGDNTIKVEGKNLFQTPNTQTLNGITLTKNTDGTFNLSGTATANTNMYLAVNLNDTKIQNGTYTISRKSTGYNTQIDFYNGNSWLATSIYVYGNNLKSASNITIPNNATMVRFIIYVSNGTTINLTNEYIQLEKGSTASEYQPYQSASYPISLGNIELCKIGTYQDRIYKDNGKWYLNKQIGKVVLNGSENYGYSQQTNNVFYSSSAILDINNTYNKPYSNYYRGEEIVHNAGQASNKGNNTIMVKDYDSQIYIIDNRFTNTTDLKTWLSTHNTTVYYVLATPTTTEITDTTLISQLEAIKKSYNTQTNISQTNDDKPFILDVVALGELEI